MPDVLRIGPYRFYFWSRENQEPPHIHVKRDRALAKFWIDPAVVLAKGSETGTQLVSGREDGVRLGRQESCGESSQALASRLKRVVRFSKALLRSPLLTKLIRIGRHEKRRLDSPSATVCWW